MQGIKIKPEALQLSLIVSIVLTVIVTILKVKNESFNLTLKTIFYNAWLGETILIIGIFLFLIFIISIFKNSAPKKFNMILPILLCIGVVLFFILFY